MGSIREETEYSVQTAEYLGISGPILEAPIVGARISRAVPPAPADRMSPADSAGIAVGDHLRSERDALLFSHFALARSNPQGTGGSRCRSRCQDFHDAVDDQDLEPGTAQGDSVKRDEGGGRDVFEESPAEERPQDGRGGHRDEKR